MDGRNERKTERESRAKRLATYLGYQSSLAATSERVTIRSRWLFEGAFRRTPRGPLRTHRRRSTIFFSRGWGVIALALGTGRANTVNGLHSEPRTGMKSRGVWSAAGSIWTYLDIYCVVLSSLINFTKSTPLTIRRNDSYGLILLPTGNRRKVVTNNMSSVLARTLRLPTGHME